MIWQDAIDLWGEELQIGMLHEEVGELLAVLNRIRRGRLQGENAGRALAEEIADVRIMLEQVEYMFDVAREAESCRQWKIDRLRTLLQKEKEVAQ